MSKKYVSWEHPTRRELEMVNRRNDEKHLLNFFQQRCNDLHTKVFRRSAIYSERCAYFLYHKKINDYGLGIDYSQHPLNPFYEH